ncbi:MAG: hypothetical protein ABSC15_13190 [Terriglobales bacterium]|jgi:hypothetical protein
MRKAILATLAIIILAICLLVYGPSVVDAIKGYWNNEQLINFWTAWIPFAISILLAFIPDQQMKTKTRIVWRVLVIAFGFFYSVLLWHQQTLTAKSAGATQQKILNAAVAASNAHSDQTIGAVRDDVKGVQTKIGSVETALTETRGALVQKFGESAASITRSLGNIGKSEPMEIAHIQFSLWREDVTSLEIPLLKDSIQEKTDGSIPINFVFINTSTVAANSLEVWMQICGVCSFVSEAPGFDRLPGMDEQTRHRVIGDMNPGTTFSKTGVSIKAPAAFNPLEIAFRYSCKTCGKIGEDQKIFISRLPAN